MKTEYYTYDSAAKRLLPAPRSMKTETAFVINPTAAQYAAIGAYPKGDTTPPTPPTGKVAVFAGYALERGKWVAQYDFEDAPPPPPRTFSKLKCVAALMKAGVWPQVKEYIEQAGLYDLYLAAQDFREDNEYFTQGRRQLQAALGWSDKQVESILRASEV